jgi:hypothetical protein
MQFTVTFTTALATFLSLAQAIPAPEQTIALFNGQDITNTTIGARDLDLVARGGVCSGSARCSNSQSLKNACTDAYNRIQQTTYSNGGDKAGVCSGHCGIFVQGTYKDSQGKKQQCTAQGYDLQGAVNTIRAAGCQTCGIIDSSQAKECKLKVDYVSSC